MNATSTGDLKRSPGNLAITARKVTSAWERMECLPKIAGLDCMALEHTVYDMLAMLSTDYEGGLWDYFRLSNGGFYMAPKDTKFFHIVCNGNGFDGNIGANSSGIIATAMAYSHLSFHPHGGCFGRAYELLSDFIFQQPDVGAIRAALD